MKQKISSATIIRTLILVFALINQILTATGYNPLPFSEDEVYNVLTGIITAAAALAAWWKNNSFSQEAIQADTLMKQLKQNK